VPENSNRKDMASPFRIESRVRLFLFLMTLHCSLLVTSTIAGAKIFALPFGLSASSTVLSYIATFVILDIIAELYGQLYSRLVINLGLVGMAISAFYFEFAIWLPPATTWQHQAAIEVVLGSSWRIWIGGWTAYLFSQYLDLWSFLRLKDTPIGKRSIAFRAWLSMLFGQFFDTIIFITIAFYGLFPLGATIEGQYMIKIIFASFSAPLVSIGVAVSRQAIGRRKRRERPAESCADSGKAQDSLIP
jgi:uncharacterized integral membrane protein (TIGR00697 family)